MPRLLKGLTVLSALAIVSLDLGSNAVADEPSVLIGVATAPCEKVLELMKIDPDQGSVAVRYWFDGFISGYNMSLHSDHKTSIAVDLRPPDFPDGEVSFAWFKSQCKANPTHPAFAIATNFLTLLRVRQGKSKD